MHAADELGGARRVKNAALPTAAVTAPPSPYRTSSATSMGEHDARVKECCVPANAVAGRRGLRDDPAMPAADFLRRDVPALKKNVFRLGLSTSFGLDEAGTREALERMQYVFVGTRTPYRAVRAALAQDRERYVVAGGAAVGWFAGSVRRGVERLLRKLGTDHLDVLQLFWLGKMSAFTPRVQEEMLRLRDAGKVRALGVSIHDRLRAGRLAEESILDLLMIRYNAAHPGAEQDVFPRLARRRPAVVAYTATSWRKLLAPPRGFTGRAATAGDCYRFCLTSPHVDVTLTGPRDVAQLRQNLAAVERGPLDADELAWMRALGKAVHG